jgi:hypothetical protein
MFPLNCCKICLKVELGMTEKKRSKRDKQVSKLFFEHGSKKERHIKIPDNLNY